MGATIVFVSFALAGGPNPVPARRTMLIGGALCLAGVPGPIGLAPWFASSYPMPIMELSPQNCMEQTAHRAAADPDRWLYNYKTERKGKQR